MIYIVVASDLGHTRPKENRNVYQTFEMAVDYVNKYLGSDENWHKYNLGRGEGAIVAYRDYNEAYRFLIEEWDMK
jgi:hypothetical protein